MRVCLAGGRLDVGRALAEATSADLTEWAAYFGLEPFGPLEDARRLGTVAAAVLAPWAGQGKSPEPKDLMPELRRAARLQRQTGEEMWANVVAFAGGGPPLPPKTEG